MSTPDTHKLPVPIFSIFGLLLIVGIVFFVVSGPSRSTQPMASPSPDPTILDQRQMIGTLVCLPHKDVSGPITLECAYGLKTDNGDHYGLDTAFFPGMLADFAIGIRVKVIGTQTTLEDSGDSQLKKYNIAGLIRVSDVERL